MLLYFLVTGFVEPLRVGDLWCPRDSHPVSGLFGSFAAASLPRFAATCPAWPGVTVGCTLNGGPNWADDARWFLVAREVHRSAIVTLMSGRTRVALPVFSPADVLNMLTDGIHRLGRRTVQRQSSWRAAVRDSRGSGNALMARNPVGSRIRRS